MIQINYEKENHIRISIVPLELLIRKCGMDYVSRISLIMMDVIKDLDYYTVYGSDVIRRRRGH